MKLYRIILLSLIFIFLYFNCFEAKAYSFNNYIDSRANGSPIIFIDLTDMKLYLMDGNNVLKTYPIAGGKSTTRSPIGTWKIIEKAADWGAGFGSRWMALSVPWGKFGIHGTNKPYSIGGAESEGCIRMFNNDIEELYSYVNYRTVVVIDGGPFGLYYNTLRDLIPGDRGNDVYEIQRRLRDRGYYSEKLDGIYGENMKRSVIKYRRDNNLKITHDVDKEFYDSIGIMPFD